jgi:large subunit ribosomal protein L9
MRVIILKDIDKVGKKYEVKDIADGYASNFLIPKRLVRIADADGLKWLSVKQEEIEKQAKEQLENLGKQVSSIDGLELEIPERVGEKGQLFEHVAEQKIANRLKEEGFNVKKEQIEISGEIKTMGEFPVKIKFEDNLEADIKVIITEEKDER